MKFGGAALLKKVALSKVIQRLGPDKVVRELRRQNAKLRNSGVHYSADVADAAEESLNLLERSLLTLRGDERVGALWGWFSSLEKNNPTLAAVILKTWLETLPGMKWASAMMAGSNSSGSNPDSVQSVAEEAATAKGANGDLEHAAIIAAIRKTHPQILEDYHLVLIPRDRTAESSKAP